MVFKVKEKDPQSFLYSSNAIFIEELYQRYISNPDLVDSHWRDYFSLMDDSNNRDPLGPSWGSRGRIIGVMSAEDNKANNPPKTQSRDQKKSSDSYFKAKFLIESYRERGHYLAKIDPLGLEPSYSKSDLALTPEDEGFDTSDMDQMVDLNGEYFGLQESRLSDLVSRLDFIYGSSIGFEISHIAHQKEKDWLYEQIELDHRVFKADDKKTFLEYLVGVETFEQYLHVKFPGAKRFSIEGLESSILTLHILIESAGSYGVSDVVLGMAHRGRLSTLAQVMGKPHRALFSEFMGNSYIPKEMEVSGDVKYHVGYSSDIVTSLGNSIHLSLAYNPSHLEAVNPVVAGKVRAQQDYIRDYERKRVMGVLVHGDAAFCGQGVVAESLAMSGLAPYDIGGIVHVITNNQVGFTANPRDQHSGRYATEVAKVANAPIFHVNAEDIEAVAFAAKIAMKYRDKFAKDVVLDIVGYRKYGHNEGDEPMYTQPNMYNVIKNKETQAAIYASQLTKEGVIDSEYYRKTKEGFKAKLSAEYESAKEYKPEVQWLDGLWAGYSATRSDDKVLTGVSVQNLKSLGLRLCEIPHHFDLHPKLSKLFEHRKSLINTGVGIDWATAEQLAFATLLDERVPIRLVGEDSCRGTFSHRHSVLHSQNNGERYVPLNNISEKSARYEVADSNLSEYAALGFEYGYSLVNPKQLVIWEAQYGDFVNGAQIIIDQFISSAETKWLRLSGLVMLLPHGYEGAGPEHSSAKLERFLQLCADDNIQVANPTTPASLFHLLRRQIYGEYRKPLIVMTPKSILRHKLVVSDFTEMDSGTYFKPVIEEIDDDIKDVDRVVICSGKVYYDLLEERRSRNIKNTAIIRIEEYYPFPASELTKALKVYKNPKIIWCQEEPKNMGAWHYIRSYLDDAIGDKIEYIGRRESASPAVGSVYVHNQEQKALIYKALNIGE
jgi:2-oxoglutarate dehydrogenase E1 component